MRPESLYLLMDFIAMSRSNIKWQMQSFVSSGIIIVAQLVVSDPSLLSLATFSLLLTPGIKD